MRFGGAFTDLEFTVAVSSLMGIAVVSKSRDCVLPLAALLLCDIDILDDDDVEEDNVEVILLAGGGDGSSSLSVRITIMSPSFRLDDIWDEGAKERMKSGKEKRGGSYPDCDFWETMVSCGQVSLQAKNADAYALR